MKTMSKGIIIPIDKDEMTELMKETKETISTCLSKDNSSATTFTVVDLWRMQKKHKTLGSSTKW